MRPIKAEFITSAVKPAQYPTDNLPEVLLVGRSNVGKSSLINRLINRKRLARTSSTPGKTQTINFYRINDAFYFVDVPGYGFAKVAKALRDSWDQMMQNYFASRPNIRLIIQLLDLRHKPSAEDIKMYHFCIYNSRPLMIVATKADKISRGAQFRHLEVIRQTLVVPEMVPIIPFSAANGTGKEPIWTAIGSYLR